MHYAATELGVLSSVLGINGMISVGGHSPENLQVQMFKCSNVIVFKGLIFSSTPLNKYFRNMLLSLRVYYSIIYNSFEL